MPARPERRIAQRRVNPDRRRKRIVYTDFQLSRVKTQRLLQRGRATAAEAGPGFSTKTVHARVFESDKPVEGATYVGRIYEFENGEPFNHSYFYLDRSSGKERRSGRDRRKSNSQ